MSVAINGADENPKAVASAKENCQRCGVVDQIVIDQRSLSEQPGHDDQDGRDGQGLLVCNPPYGKRLDLGENPEVYYSELGQQLQRTYPDWQLAMICSDSKLVKATGLPFKKIASLDNGGLKVGLFATKA